MFKSKTLLFYIFLSLKKRKKTIQIEIRMTYLERIYEEYQIKKGFLDISGCGLKELPRELLYMPWLTHLYANNNEIKTITNLEKCLNLKILYLSYNKIQKIENLDSLQFIEKLYLDNNEITKITSFESLKKLQHLDLSDNPIYWVKQLKYLIHLPRLTHLNLAGIQETDMKIPKAFFRHHLKNSLNLLRGYFETTNEKSIKVKEVPIILVGNPTAGKTSLRIYLKDNLFPPAENFSTHGIVCDFWQPAKNVISKYIDDSSLDGVEFHFWDFGGQEYYHATHRLFFSPKAIYLVLWERKTNLNGQNTIKIRLTDKVGNVETYEKQVELHSYQYWLSNIRYHAANPAESPIILIQNKVDEIENSKEEKYSSEMIDSIENCFTQSLSIKRAYEREKVGKTDPLFESFLEKVFLLGKEHLSITAYGSKWHLIKDVIARNRMDNIWTLEKFIQELIKLDPEISPDGASSYALSLQAMGLIFYYPEDDYLSQFVFINPSWITSVIYKILDQSVLESGGEFSLKHIIDKVGGINSKLFIRLMKKFDLIFENEELNLFIAPQYLPDELNDIRKSKELKRKFDNLKSADFILRFENFFPNSIMLKFLSAYGSLAEEKYYWKNGIVFILERKLVLVLFKPLEDMFHVFVENHDLYVQRLIFDKIIELTGKTNNLKVGLENDHLVGYSVLQQQVKIGNLNVAMESGKVFACQKFAHFFENIQLVKKINKYAGTDPIKIFISYSHNDIEVKEKLVNKYLKSIRNHYLNNIIIWNDAELKPGHIWNKNIKSELKNSQIVIFLLSNNFLSSEYIKKTEIIEALKDYQNRKKIIIPICIEQIPVKLIPFKDFHCLLMNKPLDEWVNQNKAWQIIVDGIIGVIDDIQNNNLEHYYE